MLQYFETLTDDSGNSLLGATCTVTNFPSGTPANIYNTNGTASPIANSTVVADITGQISFYVPDGAYTLVYSYKGTPYKTKSPVQMLDPMGFVTVADAGAANAYAVNGSQYPASLYSGLKQTFTAANSNSGPSTLNLNGTGNQPLVQPGNGALSTGAIVAGGIYQAQWNGAAWQLLNNNQPNYPQTPAEQAAGVVPVNLQYPPWAAIIDRYGNNTVPGTTDMSTALTNALLVNNVVNALAETYLFSTTTGFTLKGKRIIGAGRNATIFQVPNIAANNNAFSMQSVSGGYDTSAPGLVGMQILGNSNANAGACGVALVSTDGGGCHGGYFADVIVGGFQGAGSSAWLLSGKLNNGIYDNVFINCFGGPTTGTVAWENTIGWNITTTDAPGQPNRVNNNTWIGGGGLFASSDGTKVNYASSNTWIGWDREVNAGWGMNILGICSGLAIVGGDSENNTSGSITKANASTDIAILGGNVTEASGGTWNSFDHFFPGGTLAGKFGVDNSGNVTIAGTTINITGANPNIQASGANYLGLDTTDVLVRSYKAQRFDSSVINQSAGAITLAANNNGVVETTLTANITAITMPGAVDGFTFTWQLKQAGAGGFTVAGWPGNVHLPGGAYTMSAGANKVDMLTMRYNADQAAWYFISLVQNM